MQLHQIRPKIKNRKPKRSGRGSGSGHGKTSGRGHKGAGQRSGRLHYIGHEGDNVPFFRKIPKRGFNHRRRHDFQLVNVETWLRNIPQSPAAGAGSPAFDLAAESA